MCHLRTRTTRSHYQSTTKQPLETMKNILLISICAYTTRVVACNFYLWHRIGVTGIAPSSDLFELLGRIKNKLNK